MAVNAVGFNESIVEAAKGSQQPYFYRNGTGLMKSAEWCHFFDDFHEAVASNVPPGWAVIIDAGATVTTDATVATSPSGVLAIFDANASEGAAIYTSKSVQLTAGKKFFMEARLRTNDIADNELYFGLSSLTAVTNPEDLWTTASDSLIAVGMADGAATINLVTDRANGGPVTEATTGSFVADTWTTLGIAYDGRTGAGCITVYKDGLKILTSTGTVAGSIPGAVALAPFVGARNGNGAGSNVNLVDYVRFAYQR